MFVQISNPILCISFCVVATLSLYSLAPSDVILFDLLEPSHSMALTPLPILYKGTKRLLPRTLWENQLM